MAFGVHHPFRRRLAAWWTLVLGLVVTGLLGGELHREAVSLDRQRLALRAGELQAQLDARLEKSEMLLHNLRDYLMWSGESRNQVFARWCYENGLSINCPWLHGIAVATNWHQAQWRDKLPKPPETWTETDWQEFLKLTRREAVDCDIAMTSEVRDGKQFQARYELQRLYREVDPLVNTIRGSRATMSDRRAVMLDANSNLITGTLYYAPVYEPQLAELLAIDGLTKDQSTLVRWMHLTSVILAPVDFKVLAESVWDNAPADLGIELFSSTNQIVTNWLNYAEGTPRAADPTFKAYLTHRQLWPMYGNKFSIFFYTTPLFEAQSPRRLARVAVAGGTALTLLATALVGVALRARNQQERLTEQIREARDALAAAQKERNKVSRDLHDGTIQSLYAIQLGLGHTVRKIEADPARAGHELSAVRAELDTVIAEIRQFITADVAAAKAVDFGAVLQALVQRAQAGATARIALHCEPEAANHLLPAQAVQLANIAREALSNSLRHARSRGVQITLRAEAGEVVLEISDDGAGFDPRAPDRTGVGLTSMMSRAREAGGTFEIHSSPGQGTSITVRVPASAAEPAEAEEPDDSEEEMCKPKG